MNLARNVSILFGDKVVTDETLEMYRKKWKGYALLPGIGEGYASDEKAFHALLFETTPFTISGEDNEEQVILEASFKRFPYSIDGKQAFASFGLRLVPKQGRVHSVKLSGDNSVTVNSLSVNEDYVSVDLGSGSLHLEIFFHPMAPQTEVMPPAGFCESVIINETLNTCRVD
jgi:hypothetical protein